MSIAKKGMFYTPSFTSNESACSFLCEEEMRNPGHKAICDAGEKEMCMKSIFKDRAIINQIKQKLADSIQTRKRATRNKFMNLLGYTMLVRRSKSWILSPAEMVEYEKQCKEGINKLTRNSNDSTMNFDWWRTRDWKDISYSDFETNACLDASQDDVFFQNGISKTVLYDFVGHDLFRNDSLSEGTILILARLDAYVNTFCKMLPAEITKRTRHQKIYSDTFTNLLPLCLQQILQKVRNEVEMKMHKEIDMRSGGGFDKNDRFQNELREATTVVQFPSVSRYYVVVKEKWFSDNITREIGSVVDCVVGSFSCEDVQLDVDDMESKQLKIDCNSIPEVESP